MDDVVQVLVDKVCWTRPAPRGRGWRPRSCRLKTPSDRRAGTCAPRVLAAHYDLPYIELGEAPPAEGIPPEVPREGASGPSPLAHAGGARRPVVVATCRVFDTAGLDELRLATGREFRPVLAPMTDIDRCIKRLLGIGADTMQSMASENEGGIKVLDEDE